MANHLLLFFYLFLLVRLGKAASISTEAYWKLKLPVTPMPECIKKSLAPTGAENPRKVLQPMAKKSLASVKGYDGLVSYNKRSLDTDNPKYLSYDKQGLASTKGYDGLLSYNEKSLDSNNPKYLSYNKQGLASTNGYDGLLSYNKKGLDSNNPNYLSYIKQGLESTKGYDGLLSYNEKSLDSNNPKYLSYNKQGLASTNGYDGLLSYNKKGLDSNNPNYLSYIKQGLASTNGYDGLLSYNKKSLDSKNPKYLSYDKQGLASTNGYGGLLSYSKKNLDSNNPNYQSCNKQGLASTNGYDGLLSYNKKSLDSNNPKYLSYDKQGLISTEGYDGLLSYNKKSLDSQNPKYLFNNKQGLESTKGYRLGYKSQTKESSHVDDHDDADNKAAEDQVFFVEKDLHLGTKKTLHFQKSTRKGLFLPREVSDQIPFTSNKVEETLKILSLDPKSKEAYVLSKRIELCEEPTIEGVEKKCVTSLESMVDYAVSKLGTNKLKTLTTQVQKDSKMEYTIKGLKKLAKDDSETVVCHKMGYPYAVFFCHRTTTIRSYMVSLVGEDGSNIEAVAACHKESNDFLDNYAKNVLKIVPGSTHICHFPAAEDTIFWVPLKY